MNIVEMNIEKLIPYKNNPRKNDLAVEGVVNSIKEFGFKVPIVIDKNNVIVAGHTRLKAAKKLGIKEVPCIVADDLTPEQVKAFRLADNKVAEFSEWDFKLLESEFNELKDMDLFTGFEDFEIDSFTSSIDVDGFFEETEEKHKEKKTTTCPNCGEIFEI